MSLADEEWDDGAPVMFFVTAFSPVEHEATGVSELRIAGTDLHRVTGAIVQCPITGKRYDVPFDQPNPETIVCQITEDVGPNTGFFVMLTGGQGSWYPVGPMRRLSSLSMKP